MSDERILVVDDEFVIRRLNRRILEHAGYQVSDAANGMQAIEALLHTNFDAVLTDLRMEAGSGETLIQWILLNRPKLASRILILSADPRAQALVAFITRVSIPMISKPYSRTELLDALHRLLRNAVPQQVTAASSR